MGEAPLPLQLEIMSKHPIHVWAAITGSFEQIISRYTNVVQYIRDPPLKWPADASRAFNVVGVEMTSSEKDRAEFPIVVYKVEPQTEELGALGF